MSALIVELPPLESATEVVRRHLFPDSMDDGPATQRVLLEELSILLALYMGIDCGLDHHSRTDFLADNEGYLEEVDGLMYPEIIDTTDDECDHYTDCEAYLDQCDYYAECVALFEQLPQAVHWREVSHLRFRRIQVLTTQGLVALYV